MKKALNFIIPVGVCFLVGFVASQLQSDSIEQWYPFLNKSSLTPPNSVFPIAWSILYLLMGLSLGLILNANTYLKKFFITLFSVQLLFNFGWSIIFFYFRSPAIALADILILDVLVIYYAVKAYPVNRAASLLFVPYALWICFATYLNFYILVNN